MPWIRGGAPPWANPHVPDPGIESGPFKVYVRTDGRWIVVDRRDKSTNIALGPFRDSVGAVEGMKRLVALEEPVAPQAAKPTVAKVAAPEQPKAIRPDVPTVEFPHGEPQCERWWNPLPDDPLTWGRLEYFRRCARIAVSKCCYGPVCAEHACRCAKSEERAA